VSTVVVNTVGNLSAVNIPAGSFGVVSTGNLNAMDILAGSLNAMDTRAGSSAAANIPAASTVGASMVNVEGMASIETERERQRYMLARSSPAAMPESCLGDFGLLVSACHENARLTVGSAWCRRRRTVAVDNIVDNLHNPLLQISIFLNEERRSAKFPLTSKLSQSISATVASWATRIEPWFTSPTTQLASSTRFIARLS
jgi:hypothetical protein